MITEETRSFAVLVASNIKRLLYYGVYFETFSQRSPCTKSSLASKFPQFSKPSLYSKSFAILQVSTILQVLAIFHVYTPRSLHPLEVYNCLEVHNVFQGSKWVFSFFLEVGSICVLCILVCSVQLSTTFCQDIDLRNSFLPQAKRSS
jgi:hypothetical protein